MASEGPKILDDMSRLAGGALGALGGLRSEIEEMVRQRVERVATDFDLVTRDDFEAVREMAAEARAENEHLTARVQELETQLAKLIAAGGSGTGGAKGTRRKSGGKSTSAGKDDHDGAEQDEPHGNDHGD
ncbi:accessory factor UbiK family protein [Roseospira goensis]|uniref:BMFP domain-containing protein YqiC n=1 Tax=Roseospira goensis TaxID=391922 RepID=A0A7W6WLN9_9PROT|nr:accessory factor UbiK family protein [Roseospira goensis]MBB4286918.1 BMFP domain-containing protein YqiC [Roseospira goensis]